MTEPAARLRVLLDSTAVGALDLNRGKAEFRISASYREAHPRPVLGQTFLDDLEKVYGAGGGRVPPWFSNLLPEGALRELVADRAGVPTNHEFLLLRHLGRDLPGAVRVVADDLPWHDEPPESPSSHDDEATGTWHFSLAGVQLKFSALRTGRGLTIPVSGTGGDWIVKLPDARHPGMSRNEFATMRWAEASGIRIPEVEMADVAAISGLPREVGSLPENSALAVRRFDRPSPGRRTHIEDFAQVLGLFPEEKYRRHNYETLASVIFRLTGEAGLDEFVRRLVFVVASGNGDAHHKNWSLIYPDGVQAELSPAYDLVSTIQYMRDDRLALNLAGSKRWSDVRLDSFLRMARKIGDDAARMAARVEASVDAVLTAWHRAAADFGYTAEARGVVTGHLREIPLFLRGLTPAAAASP